MNKRSSKLRLNFDEVNKSFELSRGSPSNSMQENFPTVALNTNDSIFKFQKQNQGNSSLVTNNSELYITDKIDHKMRLDYS